MFREVINLILTLLLFVGSVYLLQIFNLALWAREAQSSVLTPGSVMLTEKKNNDSPARVDTTEESY